MTLILICLFYPTMGTRMETSLGSANFFVTLCTFSLATNVLFDAICMALYVLGTPTAVFWSCSGFWTILFSLIVIECMQVFYIYLPVFQPFISDDIITIYQLVLLGRCQSSQGVFFVSLSKCRPSTFLWYCTSFSASSPARSWILQVSWFCVNILCHTHMFLL
jgi:hypothetical protein